jgi:hypothetical protein
MDNETATVTAMDFDDARELNMLVSADVLWASTVFEYAAAGFTVQQIFDAAAEIAFADHHAPGENRHNRYCKINDARNRRLYRAREAAAGRPVWTF